MPTLDPDPVEAVLAAWCSGSSVVASVDALLADLPDTDVDEHRALLLRLREILIGNEWRNLPQQIVWRRRWLRKKTEPELAAIQ